MLDKILNKKTYNKDGQTMTSEFFMNVYTYMFVALAISGGIAYQCGTPEFINNNFVSASGSISGVFYLVVFAPVALGLLIQMAYNKLSLMTLFILFGIYAALMGLSLSTIFIIYSIANIVTTFFVTAGAFAGMAILGYTTKTDLTKFGSMLYMLFIGMFIATIVNMFMKSNAMDFIISLIGVFVFTGLTAYQMQQLKHISQEPGLEDVQRNKLALIGGLMLYILFINLFLTLLRLFGGRD
jgi:hypothetical protein